MKRLNLMLAAVIAFGTMVSCSGDDDSTSVNGNATAVRNNMKSGTWRITSFVEEGNDETNHFTGFNFTFGEDNVLTAVNGDVTHTGTWSVVDDNSSDDDDSPDSDIDFNIGFTSPEEFVDLTDDWDVLERTGTMIKLIDVSGGDGGIDYLTFEKN